MNYGTGEKQKAEKYKWMLVNHWHKVVQESAQANSKSWIEYNKKWSAFGSVSEGGVDAERRINQKGQRKNNESQKDAVVFKEDFSYFQSKKELKEPEAWSTKHDICAGSYYKTLDETDFGGRQASQPN